MFERHWCPICFRLRQMLLPLALKRGLDMRRVDVEAERGSSLMGRYRFFASQAFGGEEEVPVLLLGEERWFVPRRRTAGGGRRGEYTREEIDDACRRVVREVEEALDEEEAVYPPSHRQMALRALAFR